MADIRIRGSFAFSCGNAEMALTEEGFQAAADLMEDCGHPVSAGEKGKRTAG
jgi:hypothetical protein